VPVADTDVIIAGAGPSGLMLAAELGPAGVRSLVLEKRPVTSAVERASGFGGQPLTLLRYRQDRVEVAVAKADDRPADALLMRPDAYVA
jgi:2-polyprenyl-6-methoxyphenol hydroxylase-like FAD-dependent oxidoreductase